jgi:TolB-like protein/DNA-binding winged helix-turn-helix (wHTH) protein
MSETGTLDAGGPVELGREPDFALGRLLVRPSSCEILHANSNLSLEPRVMQVLVALAHSGGKAVTRDKLIERCWEGRVVGDAAITRCIGVLRKAASGCDMGFEIETLSKVGYRLIIRPPKSDLGREPDRYDGANTFQTQQPALHGLAPPLFPLDLPHGHVGKKLHTGGSTDRHGKPTLGVLPFINLSGEAEQSYFADGVTEDIITMLSRFRELLVAPRSSTFALKDNDLAQIVARLGVQYLLTGTIRKVGDRIRVTTELMNCESRTQIWREQYDREFSDIFQLQDELSRSVAAVVIPALQNTEIVRAKRKLPSDLNAYDLYLRALPHLWAGTKDEISKAIALLRDSVRQQNTSVPALCALSWSLLLSAPLGAASPAEALEEAFQHAREAIDLDEKDAFAQAVYSVALAYASREPEQAIVHAEEAVRLNPASTFAWGARGVSNHFGGQFERALESVELAAKLSLSDSFMYLWLSFAAAACFALERYDEGIEAARRAIQRNPQFGTAHRLLAANLAFTKRIDEAREVTRRRNVVQRTSLRELRQMGLFRPAAIFERYLEAQRLCGVTD